MYKRSSSEFAFIFTYIYGNDENLLTSPFPHFYSLKPRNITSIPLTYHYLYTIKVWNNNLKYFDKSVCLPGIAHNYVKR